MPPSARVSELYRRLTRAATAGTDGRSPRSGPHQLDQRTRALAVIGAADAAGLELLVPEPGPMPAPIVAPPGLGL